MDYEISTVYSREDIEGFYGAFLSGKKLYRYATKLTKIITTAFAVVFWALAVLDLAANLLTRDVHVIIGSLPSIIVFALLGLWLFSIDRRSFRSKASWKAYPYKGQQISFRFSSDGFTVCQPNSETKASYSGIVRLCEDKLRFYLFTSPQTAHIIPKRDLNTDIDGFRSYITASTGQKFEKV